MLEQLTSEDFYDLRHRKIFLTLVELQREGAELDPVALLQRLRPKQEAEGNLERDYITRLPDQTPSPANWPAWLEALRYATTRRAIVRDTIELKRLALDLTLPATVLADAAQRMFEPYARSRQEHVRAVPWAELNKPVDLAANLLGDRWLERGEGAILFGPSGCGKSVAAFQACFEWSAGLDGLHVRPVRPLRIAVIQTEDSIDDIRETLAGIRAGGNLTPEHLELVQKNLIILPPVPGGGPEDLARHIRNAVEDYAPDMVSVNPLLAFCPGDPARELGGILYRNIDPLLKRYRLGFLGVHHTPKMNNRDTSDYGRHDHQYLVAGDARVANWPRAMIQIEEARYPVYRFRLTKRGCRAGWTLEGKPTEERYLRHHATEVRWIDASPEDAAKAVIVENYRRILEVLPGPDEPGISRERIRELGKNKLNIGRDKADSWLNLVTEDGLVDRQETKTANKRTAAAFRRANV